MPQSVPFVAVRELAVCAALLSAGCSTLSVRPDQAVHLVCADSDGGFCGPEEQITPGATAPERNHEDHAERIAQAFANSGCTRVMLVIHGGLVSRSTGVEEALATLDVMSADDHMRDTFPIFVNWETGITRSYFDHLFYVRAGVSDRRYAIPTAPFVALADFGRAVARLPITWWTQVDNFADYYGGRSPAGVPNGWRRTTWLDRTDENDPWYHNLSDLALEVVPGITRLGTSLLLDGAGIPAYKNMRRRARVLFVRDQDHDTDQHRLSGAIPALMDAFAKLEQPPRFTVIAHSMGTLVANELMLRYGHRTWQVAPVRRRGERTRQLAAEGIEVVAAPITFENIVYMGAACSVREFANAVLPLLRNRAETKFFNLCLHPFDEADDRYSYGLAPHGSLLQWIDAYITEQESPLDRTLGTWDNAMDGMPLMDALTRDVRRRVFTRGFPRTGDGPHDHGDFNDAKHRFWHPDFWWQQPTTTPDR
jgi:pimeloyl-ACP methyl ester carboxylesterase